MDRSLNGLLGQFRSVVEELAKLPTGRTLILVSDGFNVNPRREFYTAVSAWLPNRPQFRLDDSKDVDTALHAALQVAAERDVTISAIDLRGGAGAPAVNAGSMDAAMAGGGNGRSAAQANRAAARTSSSQSAPGQLSSQDSAAMEQLARATGGVYLHSGDILKELQSALADGREYYVLAYVPKNEARDGKFRKITVDTTNKKLPTRAKSGYWAPGAVQ